MDVIQSVTVQPSTLEGCQKKELGLHRNSSGNAINTTASCNQIRLFDVIVLPGGTQAGLPLIGITQGIKYKEVSPKSTSSCRKGRSHRPLHRKSAGFKSSLFTDRGPCLSAPSRVKFAAEADRLSFPVQADLRITKNSNGVWRSKSEPTLINVRPAVTNSSKYQDVSDDWCVEAAQEVSADPLFHSRSGLTRGSFETCNLIRSKPQRETTLSPHFEAGNFEFVFVTYDMEEPEQPPQLDLDSTNTDSGEEYDPLYKCAFQFAKKHGYGFVEFVEEKLLAKKPKKRVLRKKHQTFLVKNDDKVNPVYSVSSSSKKHRIQRDRCIAKPKVNFVALLKETSPFKLAGYEKRHEKKGFPGVAKRIQTQSLPVKIPLPERIEELPTCRKMHSVTGPLMASSMREDNLIDPYYDVSQESPSLPSDAGKYTSDRYHKGFRRGGTTLTKVSARSPSAIGDAINTSKDKCQIVKRPANNKIYTVNSQSLDCKTLDNKLDILKEPEFHGSYSKKQNKSQENKQAISGINKSAENLYNKDEQIARVSAEEPSLEKQSDMILPKLKDATSLEYKLCNSMSATIFQESQLAQKIVALRKHSDKLPLANVDVVQFPYQPVHGGGRNRAPSSELPTRQRRRVHRMFKPPHCMLPTGSSVDMCTSRKAHAASQVLCDRVESWPSVVPRNPQGLSRSPEAKIYTCRSSPPIAKLISTVGDSPTKREFNSESFSKTVPQFAVINLGNGVNEQGLDLKLPTDSNLREIIFPASVPQVRQHFGIRQSAGPYNFEDSYIGKLADSFILYSSKSCRTLTEGKSRIATLDKATCGKRSATSTTRQGSVNNNKYPGYSKELADIYGECSYSQSASSYNESPDPSSSQDTNNNAVLQVADVNTNNTNQGYVSDNVGRLVGSDCNQTGGKNKTLRQKNQLMRLPVVFQLSEQIFPDGECQLHTCLDRGDIPPVTTAICYIGDRQIKKQQQRTRSANKYERKKTLAYLSTSCKKILNVCSSYAKNIVRRLKEQKSHSLSVPSTSQGFTLKYKKSECETDWLADPQYPTVLDASNNNSNNVRKKRSVSHKRTGRPSCAKKAVPRKDSMRLTRRKNPKEKIAKGGGVKIARYSITDKGLAVLQKKQNDTVTYGIGPVGYRTLYENLLKRCSSSQQALAPAKCVGLRAAVDPSCDVLECMVDSFRGLITQFPEKRLGTLQKILGLTVSPRYTDSQASDSSTESQCISSSSELSTDANTCKSPIYVCKQRPGTIYQSVAPNPNTWWNNTINPLSKGYSNTCGCPDSMTGAGSFDLIPVDSLMIYKERMSRAKHDKDTKYVSTSNNESGKVCFHETNDAGITSSSDAIDEDLATPILDQGLLCQNFPQTQQLGNVGALSGIQKLERKKLKQYLRKSILSVKSGAIDNENYNPAATQWNWSLGNDDASKNNGCTQQVCLSSSNQEDSVHMSSVGSLKGSYHLQHCNSTSWEMYNGNSCNKANGLKAQSQIGTLDTINAASKTQMLESDNLETCAKEDSNGAEKILRSPRKVMNTCEKNTPECCDRTLIGGEFERQKQVEAATKKLLSMVTHTLVEECFSCTPAVNESDTSIENNEDSEGIKENAGDKVKNCVQFTKENNDTAPSELVLPASESSVSESLMMSSYFTEGSSRIAVISRQPVLSESSLQQMTNSASIDSSNCNTQDSSCNDFLSLCSTPSGSSLPQRANSGPANVSRSSAHDLRCSTGLSNLPALLNTILQEVCVTADQQHIPSNNPEADLLDVVNNQQCASQTYNSRDDRISPTCANYPSLSSVLTQPYLKVNSLGISTHWVCVVPEMPPLHVCPSASGTVHIAGTDNNSAPHSCPGAEETCSQSSFNMPVVTRSQNYQSQLSSTDDASEEAESCNQGLAAASSSLEVNTSYTTILGEEQPSSSNSITSSVSTSQFNNNNNILPSLPLLRNPELRVQGDHLEITWRFSRQQLQSSFIQGTLATAKAGNERNVKTGISGIGVPLLNQNNDHESLIHENKKEVLRGNLENSLHENKESLLSGKRESFTIGNQENLIIGNNDDLLAANNEGLLSGNNKDVLAGSHVGLFSGSYESFLSVNRKDLLMGKDENVYSRNKGDLQSERSALQLSVNNNAWRDLNPKLRFNEEQGNNQAATSNVFSTKKSQTMSRKRRMNEPLEDMASAPKIRRLNSGVPQPVYQGPTCQGHFAGPH